VADVDELPGIVELAQKLGARAVWIQSGMASDGTHDPRGCWFPPETSQSSRDLVESAGLVYFDRPYVADAVRAHVSP
jgi:hypothetical protein